MKKDRYLPKKVLIEEDALELGQTRFVLSNLPDTPVEVVRSPIEGLFEGYSDLLDHDGEKALWLIKRHPGGFLKGCPGTTRYLCCLYRIINLIIGCPMACTYCILQDYLSSPWITLYANLEDALAEIDGSLQTPRDRILRVGTGELSDSLALDPITGLSQRLIPLFSKKDNALLELKTKSAEIDHLMNLEHRGRTVISWSLNPPEIIGSEEPLTASLDERLGAASRCQQAGYPIGLHFDPMICCPDWEQSYTLLIEKIFQYLDPDGIIWVSLGTLRFLPSLKEIMKKRWLASEIAFGELFPGMDGKLRYLKPLRTKMYQKMSALLRKQNEDIFIYLCMESPEVWKQALGWAPASNADLDRAFTNHISSFFS